jgi:hypothetical protein
MIKAGAPKSTGPVGRGPLRSHQRPHQPETVRLLGPSEKAVGDVSQRLSTTPLLVWGRVVPDIPAFCRELVAALAEG